MPGNEVEDEDTGETATDRQFKIGDKCQAPWSDGKQYEGIIVFESGKYLFDVCNVFVVFLS